MTWATARRAAWWRAAWSSAGRWLRILGGEDAPQSYRGGAANALCSIG